MFLKPMARLFDTLSVSNLDKLCRVAFWLGLAGDDLPQWEPTRTGMETFLSGVPLDFLDRFRRFLAVERRIAVPEDHPVRVANLPDYFTTRAENTFPAKLRSQPRDQALERLIPEEDSELLLRWAIFSGELPPRMMWWEQPQA